MTNRTVRIFSPVFIFMCLLGGFIIALFVINYRFTEEVNAITKKSQEKITEQSKQYLSNRKVYDNEKNFKKAYSAEDALKSPEKVIRKTRPDPREGAYLESTFFKGGEVVARYKESDGKIFDMEGSIPDGKVEFLDEITKIKGEEFYQKGKRHGIYKEFYKTGSLKKEVQFSRGRVIANKEYYLNGIVRLEQEFKNAIWDIFDMDSTKQGSGRLYFPDGTVEREWDYEGDEEVEGKRFLKIYDNNGQLKSIEYYGEEQNLIESQ